MWLPRQKKRKLWAEIHPDEILIDSSNVPEFDTDQFEGRIERPIARRSFLFVGVLIFFAFVLLLARAGNLQLIHGVAYAQQAINNQLSQTTIFADRGIITDRTGRELVSNDRASVTDDYAKRVYAGISGVAHITGYVKEPAKDSSGVYFRDSFTGVDGVERAYNQTLSGTNGLKLTETNARGAVVSESVVQPPVSGKKLTLSIDATVTEGLYNAIAEKVLQSGFQGGAGVIMDVTTGEILAMTSYPEFHAQDMTDGNSKEIQILNKNPKLPFLNRAVNGLYAPGSIVKPVVGLAALTEGVISENKQILSTGSISVPNVYDPEHPSIFKDWRANGWVDVRHAIAVSSDVYFYAVGGGYKDQPGLGIERIDTYFRLFGLGSPTGLLGFNEPSGNISTVAWKAKNFPGDPWRIGNTYHTAIGQYGTQVTPLQAVRMAAAIANGGTLLQPSLIASSSPVGTNLKLNPHIVQVIHEGMRIGVTEGIAQAVKFDYLHIAAKTGTAQIGTHNQYLNSWMIGFFPYEHPKYAYAIVLERGPAGTLIGAPSTSGAFFEWMHVNTPQYLE